MPVAKRACAARAFPTRRASLGTCGLLQVFGDARMGGAAEVAAASDIIFLAVGRAPFVPLAPQTVTSFQERHISVHGGAMRQHAGSICPASCCKCVTYAGCRWRAGEAADDGRRAGGAAAARHAAAPHRLHCRGRPARQPGGKFAGGHPRGAQRPHPVRPRRLCTTLLMRLSAGQSPVAGAGGCAACRHHV